MRRKPKILSMTAGIIATGISFSFNPFIHQYGLFKGTLAHLAVGASAEVCTRIGRSIGFGRSLEMLEYRGLSSLSDEYMEKKDRARLLAMLGFFVGLLAPSHVLNKHASPQEIQRRLQQKPASLEVQVRGGRQLPPGFRLG